LTGLGLGNLKEGTVL